MPQTFYLDIDTRSSRIFLAPFQQSKEKPYVIECETRWMAEQLLRQLNAGIIKGPLEAPQFYRSKEIMKSQLGELQIFQFQPPERQG